MRKHFPVAAPVFRVLLIAGVVAVAFFAGVNSGKAESKLTPSAIIKPAVECRLIERHTVSYIESPPAAVPAGNNVPEKPVKLRNFRSLKELEQWLAAVAESTATVYFQQPDGVVDCDDFALALQSRALAEGYIISFQIIGRGEYNSLFSIDMLPDQLLHALNLAVIGNDAFYIEPQTGEVACALSLD